MTGTLLLVLLLAGCTATRIKGGRVDATLLNGGTVQQRQSSDPKDASALATETETTQELYLPPGSKVMIGSNEVTVTEITPFKHTTKQTVTSKLGAAQKNVIGETIAKLASMRWIQVLGVLVFLFGAASAVYPPLKVIVGGSVTTSATIAAAGLGLIILPPLIVGHELLILGCCAGAAGVYFYAHRHGSLKGELTAIKNAVLPSSSTKPEPAPTPTAPPFVDQSPPSKQ